MSLEKFLVGVYGHVGIFTFITLLSAQLTIQLFDSDRLAMILSSSILMTLFYVILICVLSEEFYKIRFFCCTMLSSHFGSLLSPVVVYSNYLSPNIFWVATFTTLLLFTSCTLYAYLYPKSIKCYGHIIVSSLNTLLLLNVIGFSSFMIFGDNLFYQLIFDFDTYFGLLLFSMFVAYDTYICIKMYESGKRDYIMCSLQLYLDLMNLFVRILEIVSKKYEKNIKKQ
jgi:FtsH-binding integral membrane protein